MEQLNNCPVCKEKEFNNFLKCQDFTVSQEKFEIVSCKNCGFKFTNPRPDENQIGKYYQSENYISHSNTSKGIISKAYHLVRNYTLNRKLKLINNLQPNKGAILDVGCGTGMFLKTCQEGGWEVAGIEVDAGARAMTESQTNQKIENKILGGYQNKTFEVITLWHVLEHIHSLQETVKWINEKLGKNGHLIIAVPNYESYDAQKYKENWAAYDVPRHVYHFSQQTIELLFKQNGFQLIQINPMIFDSFYVSMLSTKYKYGKFNYWEAVINGLKSNRWARNNNKNYSSLIYIFKKV